MHWAMHAALYAGMAILVTWAFDLPPTLKTLGMILLVTLFVGITQEGLQIFSGVQILRCNTLFDLGVDTVGALLGFGVFAGVRKVKAK